MLRLPVGHNLTPDRPREQEREERDRHGVGRPEAKPAQDEVEGDDGREDEHRGQHVVPGRIGAEHRVRGGQGEGEEGLAAEGVELGVDGSPVTVVGPIPLDPVVVGVEAAVRDLPGDE